MSNDSRDGAPTPLDQAICFAVCAHVGQVDKAGEPVILHALRVMLRSELRDRVAAVLHDVIEDGHLLPGDLDILRGMVSGEDFATVYALSRGPSETYDAYLARVLACPAACRIKLLDLADNCDPQRLLRLPPEERARLSTKYTLARARIVAVVDADGQPRKTPASEVPR